MAEGWERIGMQRIGMRRTRRHVRGAVLGRSLSMLLIPLLVACGSATPGGTLHLSTPEVRISPSSGAKATPTYTPTPSLTASPVFQRPTVFRRLTPTATPPRMRAPGSSSTATPRPPSTVTPALTLRRPTRSEGGLSILGRNWFVDSASEVHLIGQVYNPTRANVRAVKVIGRFYGQEEVLLAEREAWAYVDILRPGEKTPFHLVLGDTREPIPASSIVSYTLEVSGEETEEEPFLGIQFVGHRAIDLGSGGMTILGQVVNVSDRPASQVEVACTVQDASGNALDVGASRAGKEVLAPGDNAPFQIQFGQTRGDPEQYQVFAYAQEAPASLVARQALLEVTSSRLVADVEGDLLIGEVRNGSVSAATAITVGASFYDGDDRLVAIASAGAWRDPLAPEARTPFDIQVPGNRGSAVRWEVWAQGITSDAQLRESLQLEQVSNEVDQAQRVHVRGIVRNGGTKAMASVEIGATVYDREGSVLAIGRLSLPDALAPDTAEPFAFPVQAGAEAAGIELYVQGAPF